MGFLRDLPDGEIDANQLEKAWQKVKHLYGDDILQHFIAYLTANSVPEAVIVAFNQLDEAGTGKVEFLQLVKAHGGDATGYLKDLEVDSEGMASRDAWYKCNLKVQSI